MRIIITGNMGYVGPAVVRHLRARFPDAELIGFDTGFFAHCLTGLQGLPETLLDAQYFGDVRNLPKRILSGADGIVHLAAISNDPMGKQFEEATDDINRVASVRLARLALEMGVRNFVFASSCSIYGFAEGGKRREEDSLNPLTAYARSKIATERELHQLRDGSMIVTCLRFATACGMSDRLRLDLVLNDFAAGAVSKGEISILSDGTPWRPLIDVTDMARAIEWALSRTEDQGGRALSINVGSDRWNYQVKDLAEAVAQALPGTRVSINQNAPPDRRSYQVDFSRFVALAPEYQPETDLAASVQNLIASLQAMGFIDADFRNSHLIRMKVLSTLVAQNRLSPSLAWTQRDSSVGA